MGRPRTMLLFATFLLILGTGHSVPYYPALLPYGPSAGDELVTDNVTFDAPSPAMYDGFNASKLVAFVDLDIQFLDGDQVVADIYPHDDYVNNSRGLNTSVFCRIETDDKILFIIREIIRKAFPNEHSGGRKWALIVTWVDVISNDTAEPETSRLTVQGIVLQRETSTFVLFLYRRIDWEAPTFIKFGNDTSLLLQYPDASQSGKEVLMRCTDGAPSYAWVFQLDQQILSDTIPPCIHRKLPMYPGLFPYGPDAGDQPIYENVTVNASSPVMYLGNSATELFVSIDLYMQLLDGTGMQGEIDLHDAFVNNNRGPDAFVFYRLETSPLAITRQMAMIYDAVKAAFPEALSATPEWALIATWIDVINANVTEAPDRRFTVQSVILKSDNSTHFLFLYRRMDFEEPTVIRFFDSADTQVLQYPNA